MAIPAVAIPAALGAAQLVSGIIGGNKAKKEAERLARERPTYNISPYATQAVSLAESELGNGMSAEASRAYEEGLNRDLTTSIDAILKGGGSVNNIGDVFDRSAMGRSRLAQMQDQLRLNQINNLRSAYQNMQEQQDKAFQINQYAPFADAAQANSIARQNANSNIWGGINTLGSAATGFLGGLNQQQGYNNYFNAGQQAGGYNPYQTPATLAPTNAGVSFSNNYQVPGSAVLNGNPISF